MDNDMKSTPSVMLGDEKLEKGLHDEHVEDINTTAEKAARFNQAEKDRSVWQTIKDYRVAIFWVLYGQICCCGFGIDQIIAGSLLAVPMFRKDFGEPYVVSAYQDYIIPSYWISIYTATSQLAGMVGAGVAGYLADKIGRRNTSFISCCVSIIGVGLQFAAKGSLPLLTVGKTVNGVALNSWFVLGPLYASEVAPLKLRGWLLSVTSFSTYVGIVVFTGVMYVCAQWTTVWSYQLPLALQWIIPCVVLLTVLLWPESPVWLLRVGRRDDALKSMARLYGTGERVDVDGLLAHFEETLRLERESLVLGASVGYKECFHKKSRIRTFTVMFVYCCQYLSGVTFVLGYQSYYLQIIGYNTRDSFVYTMINNSLSMLGFPISWYLISTIGRRPMLVWGQLVGAVILFVIGGLSTSTAKAAAPATVAMIVLWVRSHHPHEFSTTYLPFTRTAVTNQLGRPLPIRPVFPALLGLLAGKSLLSNCEPRR
jgi:MFS family permease